MLDLLDFRDPAAVPTTGMKERAMSHSSDHPTRLPAHTPTPDGRAEDRRVQTDNERHSDGQT